MYDGFVAKHGIELREFQLEFTVPVQLTKRLVLVPGVGLHNAHIENRRQYIGYYGFPSINEIFIRSSDSRGWGPKATLEWYLDLPRGFQFSAKTSGGLLLGKNTSKALQLVYCDPPCVNVNIDDRTSFPFLEAEVVLRYQQPTGPLRGLSAKAGYMWKKYFDSVILAQFPDDITDFHTVINRRDVSFDGIFFGIDYQF